MLHHDVHLVLAGEFKAIVNGVTFTSKIEFDISSSIGSTKT